LEQAPSLRALLLAWWEANRSPRQFPWKLRARRPAPGDGEAPAALPAWVAEGDAAARTQLAVVLPFWRPLDGRLPPPSRRWLASGEHDVLMLLEGLGYYARARRLQQGGQASCVWQRGLDGDQASAVPIPGRGSWAGLAALPGIGLSTAAGHPQLRLQLPFF